MSLPSFSLDDGLETRLDGAIVLELGVGPSPGPHNLSIEAFHMAVKLGGQKLAPKNCGGPFDPHQLIIRRGTSSFKPPVAWRELCSGCLCNGLSSVQTRHVASNAITRNVGFLHVTLRLA